MQVVLLTLLNLSDFFINSFLYLRIKVQRSQLIKREF
jgi:hypothetical protein